MWHGLLLMLSLLVYRVPPMWMHDAPGMIYGTVADDSGTELSGVTIIVTNEDGGMSKTTVTDVRGNYRFPVLDSGIYTLTTEHEGFGAYRQEGIEVFYGERRPIDVVLENCRLSIRRT